MTQHDDAFRRAVGVDNCPCDRCWDARIARASDRIRRDMRAKDLRIEQAIRRLGADREPPVGWQERVLSAIAPGWAWLRPVLLILGVAILCAAAVLWLFGWQS